MTEDASIINEVEGHYEAMHTINGPLGWCRGCEADWPCITQRLVAEVQASRKKLAAIRAIHGTIRHPCDCEDWPCATMELLDGTP